MTKKQLEKEIENNFKETERIINSIIEKQDERWESIKNYLKVEEKEYAELRKDKYTSCGIAIDLPSKAVKKTRLVKIK